MKHVTCVAVIGLLFSCAGGQPPTPCLVGRADSSPYVAFESLSAGSSIAAGCEDVLPASRVELISVQKYNPPGTAEQTLAIQPWALVAVDANGDPSPEPADPAHSQLAAGPMASGTVDAEALCRAPSLTEARQDLPSSGGAVTAIRYQFRDVQFLADAAHQGTQMGAKLSYAEGDCLAEYDVTAVFPAVSCESDADCDPNPDVAAGRVNGSGINADYPTHCDPGAGLCVVQGAFPQLR